MTAPVKRGARITLLNAERHLLNDIADRRLTRDNIAITYAMALGSDEAINWGKVNQAILDRWSPAALTYIKDKAWKFAEGRS